MSRYDHGGDIFEAARRSGTPLEDIADFSASINPLGPSPRVRDAIIGTLDHLVHYPDNSQTELRQALARHHGIPPENFTAANGSTRLIHQLPAIMTGRRALVISPSFSEYLHALRQHGWDVRHFVLRHEEDFRLDPDLVEEALCDGFDALYLCNPANPSGTLYPLETVERIIRICSSRGIFLVLDEAFMDFCEEFSARKAILTTPRGVILRSMTKFFGFPGLRLGYAIGSRDVVEQLHSRGGPWDVNTLAQAAGIAALNDREHIARTITWIRQERHRLQQALNSLEGIRVWPSHVNYLLVTLTGRMTSGELQQALWGKGILIRDCAGFTGLTDRFFRVAVRTTGENDRLIAALGSLSA